MARRTMENAYQILGLDARLDLEAEELSAAFREAGKSLHPDAGGSERDFARLRQACETLASPSRRIRHWLELRQLPAETRGTVDPALMDLFGAVEQITRQAGDLARRRAAAQSALGRALLERETQQCIEQIETAITRVDAAILDQTAVLGEIDAGRQPCDPAELSRIARNLSFLEKWLATLRSMIPRLV